MLVQLVQICHNISIIDNEAIVKFSIIEHDRKTHAFLFSAHLVDPIVLAKSVLRSEAEYGTDEHARKTALKCVGKVCRLPDKKIYVLKAGYQAEVPNKIRTKKGNLWRENELQEFECRHSEIDVGDGLTRFFSLLDLEGFDFKTLDSTILNYLYSLIIITNLDIDELHMNVESWARMGKHPGIAFDFDAVVSSLLRLDSTAVLRYFPADNGRHEMIVAVGNRDFISRHFL
jgi:hypothetical protein